MGVNDLLEDRSFNWMMESENHWILLANVIYSCILKYYVSSNLRFVVETFSSNTFVYSFVTLSPTVSDATNNPIGNEFSTC